MLRENRSPESTKEKRSDKPAKKGFIERNKRAIAGLVTGLSLNACDANLSPGYCENLQQTETKESGFPEINFAENYHLSEVQKKYTLDAVKQELGHIEPVYRQGLNEIQLVLPENNDLPKDANGDFRDFSDSIRLEGPDFGKKINGESVSAIDLRSFIYTLPIRLTHELGHSVDSLGGIKDDFISAGPTLYRLYGKRNPDFDGQNPEKEDAAEGFRIYRMNPYSFPLFYFGADEKNRAKFESLRSETFCGKEFDFIPIQAAFELSNLYNSPSTRRRDLASAYEKIVESERTPRLTAFYKFMLLFWHSSSEETEELEKKYHDAKSAAEAAVWSTLLPEINAVFAGLMVISVKHTEEEVVYKDLINEKYQSAIDSDLLPQYRDIDIRLEYAKFLIYAGKKEKAASILEPILAMTETTSADDATNLLAGR